MQLKIKICGITNAEDGLAAVAAGADALGFLLYADSPRMVPLPTAADIIRQLPPFVARVGVFVDAPEEFITRAITECAIDTLQFHGLESPGFCQKFPRATIKALRVRDLGSLEALPHYRTNAWLLDSYVPGQPGGTGTTFNWDLAREAKKIGRPVILAGGLSTDNIRLAVRQVQPYGVDVSSGVELAPGRKDHVKLRKFIQLARVAALEAE